MSRKPSRRPEHAGNHQDCPQGIRRVLCLASCVVVPRGFSGGYAVSIFLDGNVLCQEHCGCTTAVQVVACPAHLSRSHLDYAELVGRPASRHHRDPTGKPSVARASGPRQVSRWTRTGGASACPDTAVTTDHFAAGPAGLGTGCWRLPRSPLLGCGLPFDRCLHERPYRQSGRCMDPDHPGLRCLLSDRHTDNHRAVRPSRRRTPDAARLRVQVRFSYPGGSRPA